VNCILTTYAGPSLDELMYRCFGMPYDHAVANFFVSAYQKLGVMCIDGRRLKIAYCESYSASVNTLKDPADHVLWFNTKAGVSLAAWLTNILADSSQGMLKRIWKPSDEPVYKGFDVCG